MKSIVLLSFLAFGLLACQKSASMAEQHDKMCEVKTDILSPPGFHFKELGSIDIDGSVRSIQFLNDQLGYALANQNYGGYVRVFKTTDGGHSWQPLEIDVPQEPLQMVFTDENHGLITLRYDCPDADCNRPCVVLKTQDGGANWQEVHYNSLMGDLYYPQYDDAGNLYAMLLKFPEGNQQLMRSQDNGQSWDTLFNLPDYHSQRTRAEFQLYKDKLYFLSIDKQILVIDTSGDFLETIKVPPTHHGPIQLTLINDSDWLLSTYEGLQKTTDGGSNWKKVLPNWSKVVGFKDANTLLALETIGNCPVDYPFSSDRFTGTNDGGVSWQAASETTTNMMELGFEDSFQMAPGHWRVAIDKRIFEIKLL